MTMTIALSCLLLIVVVVAAATDDNDDIDSRVNQILKRMTIEDKIVQTFVAHTPSKVFRPILISKGGVGAVKLSAINGYQTPSSIEELIQQRNQLQKDFLASINNTQGIPISFVNEGNHGGAPYGTIFPMPVGLGCSWNASLVHDISKVVAAEASAIGVDTIFAPVVNMIVDPRFGRIEENYSENPILTAHLAKASILGLQQQSKKKGGRYLNKNAVAALGKHYAAYGDAAGGLNGSPSSTSERLLFDVYLRPWRSMAKAGMKALMPAHNTVLHVPCHGNPWLLNTTMRQTFGFKGIMLSDCNDILVLEDYRFAVNKSHAASIALKAGVDWDLQCSTDPDRWAYNHLQEAINDGLISEADIDTTVRRILKHKFEVGLFDGRAFTDERGVSQFLDNPKHRKLAREAAEQSIVLLLNHNKTLPIPLSGESAPKSIAILGPTASVAGCNCSGATSSLMGSYSLPGAHVVALDEALTSTVPTETQITWSKGCTGSGRTGSGRNQTEIDEAVAIAKGSELTILILGDIDGGCGEWQDRDSLDLQGSQIALLEAVTSVASKTIVILVHGRPITFGESNKALKGVDAMFAAWRPGEEFGNAIVRLISGEVVPSAKLSQSWPQNVGQVGSGSVPWLQEVRGKWVANSKGSVVDPDGRRYDDYASSASSDSSPLFYFGYGLSYTTFQYESMKIIDRSNEVHGEVIWDVEFTISNVGETTGVEVVQVYVQDPIGLPYVPFWKRLVAFARCNVAAQSSSTCSVSVLREDLAIYDPYAPFKMRIYAGMYKVSVGGSSNTDSLNSTVLVVTSQEIPRAIS